MVRVSRLLLIAPVFAGLTLVSAAPAQAQYRGGYGHGYYGHGYGGYGHGYGGYGRGYGGRGFFGPGIVAGALLGIAGGAALGYAVAPPVVYAPPPVVYAQPPVYYGAPSGYYPGY